MRSWFDGCLAVMFCVSVVGVSGSAAAAGEKEDEGLEKFRAEQMEKFLGDGASAEAIYLIQFQPHHEGQECQIAVVKVEKGYRLWVLEIDPDDRGLSLALEVEICGGLIPEEPYWFDADGDGYVEAFIEMEAMAADRGMKTFILLSYRGRSWKVFCAPILVPVIREQVGDIGMYVEGFNEAIEYDGKKHLIQPISVGDWEIFIGERGKRLFFAYIGLSEGEYFAGAHRYAKVLYRFTENGFVQDRYWSEGKASVTNEAIRYPSSEVVRNWFLEGYRTVDYHVYDIGEAFAMTAAVYEGQDRWRHTKVPSAVQYAIYDFTLRAFEKENYEEDEDGPTRLSSLFGSVYCFEVPDHDGLQIYAYFMYRIPIYYSSASIVLLVHDPRTDRITAQPMTFGTDFQDYCPSPWVRFEDIYGDSRPEILVYTGHHYGTEANDIRLYGVSIDKDLTLSKRLELKTGQSWRYAFEGSTVDQRRGYEVRTIEKQTPTRLRVTVSPSKDKLEKGSHILGFEDYEIDETGQYKRIDTIVVDENYKYLF